MKQSDPESGFTETQRFSDLLAFLVCNRSIDGLEPWEVEELQGQVYEKTRRKLIRLFRWRGSETPEELVDRTFDRVSRKLPEPRSYVGDPCHYVCGVGRLIFLESLRSKKLLEPPAQIEKGDQEEALVCLDDCMERILSPLERELILEYYRDQKREKIDRRERVASQLGLSANALRIQTCRIRRRLRKCVSECLRLK